MKTESWDKAWDSKWRQIRGVLKRLADEKFGIGGPIKSALPPKVQAGIYSLDRDVTQRLFRIRDILNQTAARCATVDGHVTPNAMTDGELRQIYEAAALPEPKHPNDATHAAAVEPTRLERLFPHEIRLNRDGSLDAVVAYGAVHLEQMNTDSWLLLIDGFDGQMLRIPIWSARKVNVRAEREGSANPDTQAVTRLETYVREVRGGSSGS